MDRPTVQQGQVVGSHVEGDFCVEDLTDPAVGPVKEDLHLVGLFEALGDDDGAVFEDLELEHDVEGGEELEVVGDVEVLLH